MSCIWEVKERFKEQKYKKCSLEDDFMDDMVFPYLSTERSPSRNK